MLVSVTMGVPAFRAATPASTAPGVNTEVLGVVKVRRGVDGPEHHRRPIRGQNDALGLQLLPDDAHALPLNVHGGPVFQLHTSASLRPVMIHTGFCPSIRLSPPAGLLRATVIWVILGSSPAG